MNRSASLGALALVLALAPTAWGATQKAAQKSSGKAAVSQAQRQYQQDRAFCMSGQSQQDRATCLKEAAAAYQEARRGTLATRQQGANLSQNMTQRCDAQPAADREACVQRILGAGSAEGSVEGGGIIRSTETPVK